MSVELITEGLTEGVNGGLNDIGSSLDFSENNSKKEKFIFEKQTGLVFNGEIEGSYIKFLPADEFINNGKRKHKRKTYASMSRDFWRLTHSFNNPELSNDYVLEEFRGYKERCKKRYLCFKDIKGQRAYSIAPTRYSRSYQRKVATSLSQLFERNFREAVFLTLTFNPKKWSKERAWSWIGEEKNRFLTGLEYKILNNPSISSYLDKQKEKRKERKRVLKYLATIEAHKNGYPHIHILFFGVKRLVDWREIEKLWDNGFIWINQTPKGEKIKNPIAYMFKYITKTFKQTDSKNELTQSYLWYFTKRSYSVTEGLVTPINLIKNSEWSFEGFIFFIGVFNEDDIMAFLSCSDNLTWLIENVKNNDFG